MKSPTLLKHTLNSKPSLFERARCFVFHSFSCGKRRSVVLSALYSLCLEEAFPSYAERVLLINKLNLSLSSSGLVYPMFVYLKIWNGATLKDLEKYNLSRLAERLAKRVPRCFRYGTRALMKEDILRVLHLAHAKQHNVV